MVAPKRYYPAFLDLDGRLVVVVGPGAGIERKARQLTRYGADVLVITPNPSPQLIAAEADGDLGIERRVYVRGDLEGAALVLCLSPDDEVRRAVFEESLKVGCPVNVSGAPRLSTFISPSLVHREPLQIALSTGGVAPQLAKHLRERLSGEFGEEWGRYTQLIGEVRVMALEQLDDLEQVDALVAAAIESDVLEQLREGKDLTSAAVFARFAPVDDASSEDDVVELAQDD